MEKLFIPTLHTFAMNNNFTGSLGLFRFRAAPEIVMATPKEVDYEKIIYLGIVGDVSFWMWWLL